MTNQYGGFLENLDLQPTVVGLNVLGADGLEDRGDGSWRLARLEVGETKTVFLQVQPRGVREFVDALGVRGRAAVAAKSAITRSQRPLAQLSQS